MKKLVFCLVAFLILSQLAVADYIVISGGNDSGVNGGQSITRCRDDFRIVWQRSPATGQGDISYNSLAINPLTSDIYTAHFITPNYCKHFSFVDGAYIGRPVPGPGQTDGTGTYTVPATSVTGNSLDTRDLCFGYDYNGDGVEDLWVTRRDRFEVYDGTTLNRTGDTGTADILAWSYIADSAAGLDGTGAFGFCFGPDVTGDGVGELYAMKGINAATGSRLNVWNPVTLTQVASYNADGTRDDTMLMLGPDVNGDGIQDLWVTDARNHRLRAYDCATGAIAADSISLVKASDPNVAATLRQPKCVRYGPAGTILVTTRFATSLDPQWTGPADLAGGNFLQIVWDSVNQRGLTTLLYESNTRIDGVAYVTPDVTKAIYPEPSHRTQDVLRDVRLSWTPGIYAAKHNVYFGKDPNDVNEASIEDPCGVLIEANWDANSYDPPGLLDWNNTYYWRVDEVNAPTSPGVNKGTVWSFTVTNFTIVDNFEAYNDVDNLVYNAWLDCVTNNTGMTVGHTEPGVSIIEKSIAIVRSGKQSMYMRYDNDGSINPGLGPPLEKTGTLLYSEAEREWTDPQDWTKDGAASLRLWFRGQIAASTFSPGPPIVMTGSGADIWGNADGFHYAFKQLSGDGSITAKVLSLTNTHASAKAGVMIRETLDTGSKHASMVIQPTAGASFVRRTTLNGSSTQDQTAGFAAPYWVRLTRSGNTFTAERSADGITWVAQGTPQTITMLTEVYVGLCLTSHNVNAITTAEFSDISTSGTGDLQLKEIGIQSNVPEQLYIALQDSAGNNTVIKHSDPASSALAVWTEWPVLLTDFTDQNPNLKLNAIKKMYIGVGDRASTTPGGSGTLYIDDVRLNQPTQ